MTDNDNQPTPVGLTQQLRMPCSLSGNPMNWMWQVIVIKATDRQATCLDIRGHWMWQVVVWFGKQLKQSHNWKSQAIWKNVVEYPQKQGSHPWHENCRLLCLIHFWFTSSACPFLPAEEMPWLNCLYHLSQHKDNGLLLCSACQSTFGGLTHQIERQRFSTSLQSIISIQSCSDTTSVPSCSTS